MGIYNDSLTLAAQGSQEIPWPFPLRLGVYVRFILDSDDQQPDHFQLAIRHETTQIAKGEGILQIQDPAKPVGLAMPIPVLFVPSPGYLHFRLVLSKGATTVFDRDMDRPLAINRP